MGRRCRRIRRFAHRVVEITRRLWAICSCCGTVREEFQRDTVPLASVISGSVKQQKPSIQASNKVGPCCQSRPAEHAVRVVSMERRLLESLRTEPSISDTCLGPDVSPKVSLISKFSLGSLHNAVSAISSDSASGIERSKPGTDDLQQGSLKENNAIEPNSIPSEEQIHFYDCSSSPTLEGGEWKCEASQMSESIDYVIERSIYGSLSSLEESSSSQTSLNDNGEFRHLVENFRRETILHLSPHLKILQFNKQWKILKKLDDSRLEFRAPITQLTASTSGQNSSQHVTRQVGNLSVQTLHASAGSSDSSECIIEFASDKLWCTVRPKHWNTKETISLSQSSVIELVYLKKFRQKLAVKAVSRATSQTEASLLIECQSSFVSRLRAVLVQGELRYLCMVYYERRDLAQWLDRDKERKYFGESEAICISSYLLVALDFLHNKKILHLDVKPENVLIEDTGYPILCGFGSAWKMDEGTQLAYNRTLRSAYTCPELLSSTPKPSKLSDLWSVGCMFYKVITGNVPTVDASAAENDRNIVELTSGLDVSMMSWRAQDFVLYLLEPVPSDRLGFSDGARQAMKHRVFRLTYWDDVRFGHRQERCELLDVLETIEEAELKRNDTLDEPLTKSKSSLQDLGECEPSTSQSGEIDTEAYVRSLLDWSSSSSEDDSEESTRPPLNRELYIITEEKECDLTDEKTEKEGLEENNELRGDHNECDPT